MSLCKICELKKPDKQTYRSKCVFCGKEFQSVGITRKICNECGEKQKQFGLYLCSCCGKPVDSTETVDSLIWYKNFENKSHRRAYTRKATFKKKRIQLERAKYHNCRSWSAIGENGHYCKLNSSSESSQFFKKSVARARRHKYKVEDTLIKNTLSENLMDKSARPSKKSKA